MPRNKKKEPYEGYKEDLKTIETYFTYLRTLIACNPELTKKLAENIREQREKGD